LSLNKSWTSFTTSHNILNTLFDQYLLRL